MDRRDFIISGFALSTIGMLAGPAAARSAIPYYSDSGLAIYGADPVAYFAEGKAVPGTIHWSLRWRGVVLAFASAENRARFETDPTHYAPQFGGYCAFGMSERQLFTPDPEAFAIWHGALYLTHSPEILAEWLRSPDERICLARENWERMRAGG